VKPLISVGVDGPGLNGLVEGVGREVLGSSVDWGFKPGSGAAGEKREGNVPALVLRVADCGRGASAALP
jgi:hypothetical protein